MYQYMCTHVEDQVVTPKHPMQMTDLVCLKLELENVAGLPRFFSCHND